MILQSFLTQRGKDAKAQKFDFSKIFASSRLCLFAFTFLVLNLGVFAQTEPPPPGAPKSVRIPAVKEKKLSNGLTVAVVERKNVPLVTVQLLVKAGAESEGMEKAGLANMTASLLTKGTATRSATDIAEQIEFLGGSIDTGAGWNNSVVFVNVMADKLDQALAIMSDVVLNPKFDQKEIDLLKSQTLDGLTYNLTQPGFLANYVAAKYSFNEHPAGGTPDSINSLRRDDFANFHRKNYVPQNSVLIFTGDISAEKANELAQKYFGDWKNTGEASARGNVRAANKAAADETVRRILVLDLPNSGQAAVSYAKNLESSGRTSNAYYPASVLNSLLGGGYSSRLNQEIRIKRGLSYGAGSSFAWRLAGSNFGTRTQTKNESAAEVAELVIAEINKLSEGEITEAELNPRKLVLTGGFGRNLETNAGLAAAIADLYSFGIPASELNNYMKSVQSVSDAQIKSFAGSNLKGGDIIIVGDYNVFKDDLAKRFPNMKVEVIKAAELDLTRDNLRKSN
jgi:zinc protease